MLRCGKPAPRTLLMQTALRARSLRRREIFRVAALALLLLAVADLALPQLCGEANESLFAAETVAGAVGHADGSGESLPHQAPSEDCFCCCSHIVSEDSASPLHRFAIVSGSGRIALPSVPAPPLQLLFHPPRLA